MTRDKIIRAFEWCRNQPTCDSCDSCKYGGRSFMTCERLADDILSLLEEQEPKPVGKEWNECPNCGKVLSSIEHTHFCGMCGQAVKWHG